MTVCVVNLEPGTAGTAEQIASVLREAGASVQVRNWDAIFLEPAPVARFVALASPVSESAAVYALRKRIGAVVLVVLGPDDPLLCKRLLDAGADDYLRLDTPVRNLLGHLCALERLGPDTSDRNSVYGSLCIGFYRGDVKADGRLLPLSNLEYRALRKLVGAQGEVVPRDELLQAVWGDREISDNALDACMHRLRAKLEKSRSSVRLCTMRGIGYRVEKGD